MLASEANGRVQLTHHDSPAAGEAEFVRAMQLGAVDPGQIVFKAVVALDPAVQKLMKDQPAPKDIIFNPAFRDHGQDHPFRTAQITWHVPGGQLELDPAAAGKHTGAVEFAAVILDDQGVLIDSSSATINMSLTPTSYEAAQTSGVAMILKVAIPEKGDLLPAHRRPGCDQWAGRRARSLHRRNQDRNSRAVAVSQP